MCSSLFLIKVDFFLPQTAQFDKSIILICLVFLTLEFSLAVCFSCMFLSLLKIRHYNFLQKKS